MDTSLELFHKINKNPMYILVLNIYIGFFYIEGIYIFKENAQFNYLINMNLNSRS